ncbi:MAG TPA: transporter substrate-binding domain-containing protein [Legionella sp.]|nr:transporter substrate-binding domain-containing protein [Legionella sp.]
MKTRAVVLTLCLYFICSPLSFAAIKVGTLFFDPPFVLSVGQGFDNDFMRLLCKKMNEECISIPMDYHKMYTALNSGQIDIAIGSIAISPARQQNYIFSLPYMLSKVQFMTLKHGMINSIDDLTGTSVGVIKADNTGGVTYNFLTNHYEGKFEIKRYNDIEDLVTALSSNEVSAALLHRSSVVYWVENSGDQFKALGGITTVGDGIGIMALPKNEALIQRINKVMVGMETNNEYLNLYNTYFADE